MGIVQITKVSYEHLDSLRTFFNENNIEIEASEMIEFIASNEVTLAIENDLIVNASVRNLNGEIKYITGKSIECLESNK